MEDYAWEKRNFARLARARYQHRRASDPSIEEIQASFQAPEWNESTIAHKACPLVSAPSPLMPRPPRNSPRLPQPLPRSNKTSLESKPKSPQRFKQPIVESQKGLHHPPIVQSGWQSPRSSLRQQSTQKFTEHGRSDCSTVDILGLPVSKNDRTITIKTHRSYSVVDDVTGITEFSGVATAVDMVPIDAELNALVFEKSRGYDFNETMKFAPCCRTQMATRADTAFALSESAISQEFLELPRRSPRIQARRKRKADEDSCDDVSRAMQLPKKDSMRGKINRRIRTATRKIADKVAKKLLNEAQNALSKDKDEEKVAGGSSEGRRSADALNIDVHEPEVKRRKTVSTAKKVICKSLKVFATIQIELTVAAGVGQYKAQFTFRKTPEQRQREVRESILCSPARRAITFDERDEDVFSPRRAISSRRISHGAPRYVDVSERYYAPENITIVEEGESAETSLVKDDNDAQVVASTLRGAASKADGKS
ncbi:unnamed protein product [Oikopleura dioica]|uniref:Uncharacterized protein n=1 Tax=Oikopleura dioica TaxID=34765 RepID=E4XLE1_OIKDI|nr:unnamed protein product [Oikopleura dioica]